MTDRTDTRKTLRDTEPDGERQRHTEGRVLVHLISHLNLRFEV